MTFDTHANFASGKITVAPSTPTGGTTLSMSNADAANFPDPAGTGNTAYNLVVWAANQNPLSSNSEVLRITAKGSADSGGTGNTQFTFTRLTEQNVPATMTARSIQVGDWGAASITKKWWTDVENALNQKTVVTVSKSAGADYYTGNYSSDDACIQAAINAVNTAGGGIVQIKAGTYTANSTILLKSNILIRGEGKSTVIIAKNALNADVIQSASADANTYFFVKDLVVDGNYTNQTTGGTGINVIKVTSAALENVIVQNTLSHGINIDGAGGAEMIWVVGCTTTATGLVFASGGNGISVTNNPSRVYIERNRAYNNGSANIALEGQATNVSITGNFCKLSGQNALAIADNITGYNYLNSHITVTNNQCSNGGNHGIHMAGVDVTISNNQVDTTVNHGIYFASSSESHLINDYIIANNNIRGAGVYGIRVANAVMGSISSNTIETSGTTGILVDLVNDTTINNNKTSGGVIADGIRLHRAKRNNVFGNTSKNNARYGIYLSDDTVTTTQFNTVSLNHCYDDQVTKTQQYGIISQNSSDYNFVYGNMSLPSDHTTGGISLAGSNNYIGLNVGLATINMGRNLSSVAGLNTTIQAEGAANGGTNLAGGNLILSGGISTGSGRSAIEFWSAFSASSGTTDRTPTRIGYMTAQSSGNFLTVRGTNSVTGIIFPNSFLIDGDKAGGFGAYRNTTVSATSALTVQGISALSGGTDKAGGNLVLASGISTGTGTSQLIFQTPTPQGSTNTTDNSLATRMTISSAGIDVASNKITSVTDPSNPQDAATKAYVDAHAGVSSVNSLTGTVTLTTANITEVTNLYYTDARVRLNRLDQMAAPTASVSMNSQKITSLLDPTGAQDAATKNYVDFVAQGLSVKPSAIVATTTTLPTYTYLSGVITMTATGVVAIDGHNLALNDIVLVKNETSTNQPNNGLYTVTTAGAIGVALVLTRHTSMDASTEFAGAFVFVETGTVNAAAGFVCTNSASVTVGTTNISFTQFSGAGEITAGNGLSKSGNTLTIDTTITADLTTAQTFTNKILTSPVINTPTGIVQADVGGLTTASTPTFAGLSLGTGNLSTVGNVSIDGSAARNITVTQNSGATGQNLTVQAGSSIGTGSNEAGGALLLSAGVGTGNSTAGFIAFYTATDGTTGTTVETTSEKMRLISSSAGRLLIGTTTNVSGGDGIIMGGAVARTIQMVRQTGSASAGNNLTIFAGGASLTGTDKAGGNLIMQSGTATGTGTSQILLKTPTPQGSTNTTDNAPTTRLTIDSTGLTIPDAHNLILGTSTGTKIGTATTQKIGFFNATPIVQGTAFTQTYATASHTHANITASNPPAGGTGATAGAYDTSAHRDAMITSLTNNIADVANVKQVLNGLIDDLQALGLVA